jgi:hypothetical protein
MHQDGSTLSEGLAFFSAARFTKLVLDMKCQFLPFLLNCEDECADCGDQGGNGGQGGQTLAKAKKSKKH